MAKQANIAKPKPRDSSDLNRLHKYDGNVVGGLLLGCGMALTGACPGTVLVQVASGISSGFPVLFGGILGGLIWSRFGHCAKCAPPTSSTTSSTPPKNDHLVHKTEPTVYKSVGLSSQQGVLLYEMICLSMIISASYFRPDVLGFSRLSPIIGGLLIGGAQAASLLLTKSPFGVSTAYERMGQYLCRITGMSPNKNAAWPSPSPIVFAIGMVVGSWCSGQALGLAPATDTMSISIVRGIVGGAALIIGARTAGGCTSGHGISGMSTLSKASFVTVGAMFAGGIILSSMLRLFA